MWIQVRKRGLAETWAYELNGVERISYTQFFRPRKEVEVFFNSYDGEFITSIIYQVSSWIELRKRTVLDLKSLLVEEVSVKQQIKKIKKSHNKKINSWKKKIENHVKKENITGSTIKPGVSKKTQKKR